MAKNQLKIQKELYELCISDSEVIENIIMRNVITINYDELIDIAQDIIGTEKNIYIVCFDDSEEILNLLENSNKQYKLLPPYCNEEWENVVPKLIKGKFN